MHLLEDRLHLGMIAAQREDAPAGQQIEIFVPVGVPEIAPFAADVTPVEPDGPKHLHECRVHMFGVKVIFTSAMLFEPCDKVFMHPEVPHVWEPERPSKFRQTARGGRKFRSSELSA